MTNAANMDASPAEDPSEIDDLQRVLGYVDAIDDREGLREIAPDMLVLPFWTPRFCHALIRAAEAVGAFEPQVDDPVPGHEVSLAIISPRLFAVVEQDLGERIWPQLQQVWPYIDYHGLRDAFVIRYALGEQESLRIHHDVAQVSASVKLNSDYEGGVLEFPRQGSSNEVTEVGELLVWPSLVTHPHETAQLRAGVKYALTVWFELPGHVT
jgi:2OG-Fe(II) oxygenase superfamily